MATRKGWIGLAMAAPLAWVIGCGGQQARPSVASIQMEEQLGAARNAQQGSLAAAERAAAAERRAIEAQHAAETAARQAQADAQHAALYARPAPSEQRAAAPGPAPRVGARAEREEVCPADLQGLQARAMDVPEGGELVLTTDAADVAELRTRMERFARLHNQARAGRAPDEAAPDEPSSIANASARTRRAHDGVRVILRAASPDERHALRDELRETALELARGRCPLWMESHG